MRANFTKHCTTVWNGSNPTSWPNKNCEEGVNYEHSAKIVEKLLQMVKRPIFCILTWMQSDNLFVFEKFEAL